MLHALERPAVFRPLDYDEFVLGLHPGFSEQDVDEQCFEKAKAAGLFPDPQNLHLTPPTPNHDIINNNRDSYISFSPSATTASTTSLRSYSIESRNSFSTDLASNISIGSRSQGFSHPLRGLSRFSSRDGGADGTSIPSSLGSFVSLSLAPPRSTASTTSLSLSTSSLRKPFSVRRGLGRYFKKNGPYDGQEPGRSPTCYGCPNASLDGEQEAIRLDCGHAVCYRHFLQLLANAESWPQDSSGTCCGLPSHRQPHASFSTQNLSLKYRLPNYPSAGRYAIGETPPLPEMEQNAPKSSVVSKATSVEAQQNLAAAMQFPDFRDLRAEQSDTAERFYKFWTKQSSTLFDYYTSTRRERISQWQKQASSLREAQSLALSRLEEHQLSAEMDLREVHEQEKNNCSLALRHMEGYLESGRPVTEQDRRELDKQYWVRDHLSQRHESAINVLREQQARQVRIRSQDHDKEMGVLQLKHQRSIGDLERAHRAEVQELDDLFLRRRARLVVRWGLSDEVWRRTHNQGEEDVKIGFPIAPPDWPLKSMATATN